MRCLSRNLLTLLLALLLGFSPLQGVMAGAVSSTDRVGDHQASMSHGMDEASMMDHPGMEMLHQDNANHCDQCPPDMDCSDMGCQSNHCSSSVVGLLSSPPTHLLRTAKQQFQQTHNALAMHRPSSLFRPPKA